MFLHLAKKQYLRAEIEPTHKETELHTFNVEYFSLLIRSSRACF